jgi:thioredoxin reductase (NADPH)
MGVAEGEALPNSRQDCIYDVIVIGGGPAGATAALYAARGELKTLIVDKGLRTGALGLASKVANYPGIPGQIEGAELLGRIREQAQGFGAEYVQDKVLTTELEGDVKAVWGTQGLYQGKTVIVATGSMGRSHTVPGEERLLGAGVSYCATCDGAFFRDQEVAVAGNNEEAVEEALLLTKFARRVHLLVQTPQLRVPPELAAEVSEHPQVLVHLGARLQEVLGDQQVEGVRVMPQEGEERVLDLSGVFIYLQGGRPITDFLERQLPTSEAGCLEVDGSMHTTISGVFAVGDVLCTHLKQAVIAAAEGAIAAMAVQRYLSGRSKLRPDWS